jgi:hypothetical protein
MPGFSKLGFAVAPKWRNGLTDLDPGPQTRKVEGFVEFASTYQLRGWVYAPDAVGQRLSVEAYIDDVRLAGGRAAFFRRDLADVGIGDGHHGFVLNFDVALSVEDLGEVAVYARTADGERHTLSSIAPPHAETDEPKRQPKFNIAAPLATSNSVQRPVFILGAKRSGTSAVTQALLRSGRYAGQEEGHLLGLVGRLIELVEQHYEVNETEVTEQRNTFITSVPEKYFFDSIRGVFAHLTLSVFPSGYWIDKTPNSAMVQLAPLLKEIWPNAKFVFMKRRGIENLVSRSRKFPETAFRERCEDWRNVMEAWLRVRDDLSSAAIEIEQLDLVREPDRLANDLARFLAIPDAEAARFREALVSDRPERSASNFGQIHDFESAGWSASEVKKFKEICGAMMAVYGYGYSGAYYR